MQSIKVVLVVRFALDSRGGRLGIEPSCTATEFCA
jgi:hypothetical protein